jgi:hypothetical protein
VSGGQCRRRRRLAKVRLVRCSPPERLVRTPQIIPVEELTKAALLFDAVGRWTQVDPFVLHGPPQALDKDVVVAAPGLRGEVFNEANAFCASQSKYLQPVTTNDTPGIFGRSRLVRGGDLRPRQGYERRLALRPLRHVARAGWLRPSAHALLIRR